MCVIYTIHRLYTIQRVYKKETTINKLVYSIRSYYAHLVLLMQQLSLSLQINRITVRYKLPNPTGHLYHIAIRDIASS